MAIPKPMSLTVDGFDIWQTGGGCVAFGKTYPNKNYTMVTDEGGANLPAHGSCLIVTYDPEGEAIDQCTCDNERQMNQLVETHGELHGE